MLLCNITPANDHDINFLKKNHLVINATAVYGDKAYISDSLKKEMKGRQVALVCPPKKPWKGELKLGQHLLSSLISGTRQTIETAFGWLDTRTNIAKANKARSEQGVDTTYFWFSCGSRAKLRIEPYKIILAIRVNYRFTYNIY